MNTKFAWFVMVILMVVACAVLPAPAATNTIAVGGSSGYSGPEGTVLYKAALDFSTTTVASNDLWTVLTIPAGAQVQAVQIKVTTAATNAATVNLGDTDSETGWGSAVSLTNATATLSVPVLTGATNAVITVTPTNGLGKKYVAANALRLRFSDAPGKVGAISVQMLVAKFD